MPTPDYETIELTTEGPVARLTLGRPSALNALNATMMHEVVDALGHIQNHNDIRALVVNGKGRAFAAGADIAQMRDKTFAQMADANYLAQWEALSQLRIPTIAAVNGYALGGGCELAMMCDLIVAGRSAKFGQPEILLGIIPGIGGTQRLTRAVGKAKAMDLILTGRQFDAEEAERLGIVSRVVDDAEVLTAAHDLAARIATMSARAVLAAKECVLRAQEATLAEGLLFERRWFHSLFAFDDQTEGMSAFLEKREAQFNSA